MAEPRPRPCCRFLQGCANAADAHRRLAEAVADALWHRGGELVALYALFAGVAWVLGYWIFKKRWWQRKIIQKEPAAADVRRDLRRSALTVVIYGLVGTGTRLLATSAGWKMYYKNIDRHGGWTWFVASILIAVVVVHAPCGL